MKLHSRTTWQNSIIRPTQSGMIAVRSFNECDLGNHSEKTLAYSQIAPFGGFKI